MSMRTRRVVIWSAVIATIAVIATALAWPKPMRVEVATASSAPMTVYIDADARTRVRDRFTVVAPVGGQVERIAVHVGDWLNARDVVARVAPLPMDSATLSAARARESSARASLDDANARVRQATLASTLAARTAERYRALEGAGGASTQDRERTDLEAMARAEELAAARARVFAVTGDLTAARAALPNASGRLPPMVIRAPIAGRVLSIVDESARIVAAGTPLLDLGRDADLEIVADVLTDDAVRIPPRAAVQLLGWGGDGDALHGTVQRVEPSARTRVSALGVEEQRVNVIVAPTQPLPLGDGFHADARIIVWSGNALQIPASAVFSDGAQSRVFVVVDGRARERNVSVGRRSDVAVQILAGLGAGDQVILFPSDRIRSGSRVRGVAVSR